MNNKLCFFSDIIKHGNMNNCHTFNIQQRLASELVPLKKEIYNVALTQNNIPKSLDYTIYRTAIEKFDLFDCSNTSIQMLKQNQESLYYGQQLANGSYNTLIGNVVEEVMKKHPCGLYQIGLDVSQSPFMHTGIYTEKIVKGYLKVMEKHPCLVTRLGNGKVNIQHLTRHPVTEDDFTYISNLDLDSIEGAQFIINKSFEISEKLISWMKPADCINHTLYNDLISNSNVVHTITEEGIFHVCNNGTRLPEVVNSYTDQLNLDTNEALNVIDSIFSSLT